MFTMPASSTVLHGSLAEQCRNLPDPVRRYLVYTLGVERRPLESVVISQAGTLRSDPGGGRWMSFAARHRVEPQLRQFEWDARIRFAPLLQLRVCDAYAGGVGQGQVYLWSRLKLASERNVPELNEGALHRFLAEAPWYPDALLPSAGTRWSAIDDYSALATLENCGTKVSLEFRFRSTGEVASIYTPQRWRRVGSSYRRCAWEGCFSDYRSQQGLRVPFRGEVGWIVDGQLGLVWRGEIAGIEYTFSRGDS